MKLANTHIFIIALSFALGSNNMHAQEIWSLQKCIDTAQIHNKNLQINQNLISLNEQRNLEAKANLIPKIQVNADYKYFTNLPHQLMPMSTFNPMAAEGEFKEAQFGVPHNINANLQFSMPLYHPQLYGGIKSSKIAKELTQLQFQKTEEQVLFDITTYYYNAQILQHQLAFIDSNLTNTQQLLENIQLLHEHLLAMESDVNKIQLQADQLSTQRESVNNKYLQILNALKFSMGIHLDEKMDVENDIVFQEQLEYKTKENIEIRIINTHNKLLKNELHTLNRSRYLPSLYMMGSYGTTGFGYDKSPNEFLKFFTVGFAGIQLSYPLFNGTVTHRKINQKKLEILNNELQSQLVLEKNDMEIENAERQKLLAKKFIGNTQNQIDLAKSIYNQTIIQQQHGTANLSDVLLADTALRESQQSYLSAIIDFLKADLDLKTLKGQLSTTK